MADSVLGSLVLAVAASAVALFLRAQTEDVSVVIY